MTTIKSFTSLDQSKKLLKILKPETADMWYSHYGDPKYNFTIAYEGEQWFLCQLRNSSHDIPCWSLAALLSVIRETIGYALYGVNNVYISCNFGIEPQLETEVYDSEVDTCVAMIEKLHERKMM